jgi:hypothetical protein
MSLKLVTKGSNGPKIDEGKLFIVVTGDSHDELLSPAAKKTAYDFRFDKECPSGFGQAGIEVASGIITILEAKHEKLARVFKLTPGL